MKQKLQNYFSQLGRSFLPAVAVMSFYALLLSVGAVLRNPYILEQFPALANPGIQFIATMLNETEMIIIRALPLIFAVSIACGMVKNENKGAAALSAVVGYLFMLTFTNLILVQQGALLAPDITVAENGIVKFSQTTEMKNQSQNFVMGIQTIDTSVLGGIVIGCVAAATTNKWSRKTLPLWLGFYQGKNWPPVATAFFGALIGIAVPFIWPFVGGFIYQLAAVIAGLGILGSFLFGFIEQLLVPTGLHHIWYGVVHYTAVGGTAEVCGVTYEGTKAITVAALSCPTFEENISDVTRLWLGQGAAPIKIFGIPGALVGVYLAATNKSRAKAVCISAAAAAIFAGVTEPFDFMFLFLSPMLYLIHCAFMGLSFAILDILNVSYLGGSTIFDLVINGVLQGNKSDWQQIVIVGIGFFFAYMGTFYWWIKKFNIMTPGREPEEYNDDVAQMELKAAKMLNQKTPKDEVANYLLENLGGKANIESHGNCISRLRIFVKNPELLNLDNLQKTPDSMGMANPAPNEIHIIFGMKVAEYADAFSDALEK